MKALISLFLACVLTVFSTAAMAQARVGGYEFAPAAKVPTVTAGSYSNGQSIGGLITVPISNLSTNVSGILNTLGVGFNSGLAATVIVYAYQSPPSASCADQSNFVPTQADNKNLITKVPVSITTAKATTAGDGQSYGDGANLALPFLLPSGNSLSVCVVAGGSGVTPGSTTDMSVSTQGTLDLPGTSGP